MPLLAPLLAFIGTLLGRLGQWFLTAFITGALKTMVIATTMIVAIVVLVYNFVVAMNAYLLELITGLNPTAYASVMGIIAMLPTNLPYLVTIIVSYYVLSVGLHLSIEIAKMKAKWAEKALSHFKA